MSNEKEEKILEFVRRRGPVLPIQVSKEFGIESFLSSAILSSLKNSKKIQQSFRKVGSSPLYYTPEQEQRARNILYEELGELEKKALARLKELKIAFKDELYPQERVLLSELRDFVSYLRIEKDNEEIFCWKHYSVSDEEFEKMLAEKLGETKEEPVPIESKEVEFKPKEVEIIDARGKSEIEKETAPVKEEKIEKQTELKPSEEIKPESSFEEKVLSFLKEHDIEILEREKNRSDINLIVLSKTPLGEQRYFVKAKDKKSVNKGDVSKCYVESLSKKYPVIMIVPKDIRKSVKEYVDKHFKDLMNVIVVK